MRLILVESPFAGRPSALRDGTAIADHWRNVDYAKALCRFLALRGDAPYASHLLLTRFLDDGNALERSLGIEIGLAWGSHADVTVVGVDRGISKGMRYGIERARKEGRPVEWVSLAAHCDEWLPHGVMRGGWIDLFVQGDKQVRDD